MYVHVIVCAEQSKLASTSYLDLLRALNVGVTQWISNHVEKNPYVDLTPIFRDYEKHLEAIDLKVHKIMMMMYNTKCISQF